MNESSRLRQQLSQTEQNRLQLEKEFESNEFNTRRKADELNRSRQAVLDRTREEYEKLLRKYTDLDEVYRELATLRDEDLCKTFIFSSSHLFRLRSIQPNRKPFERNSNVSMKKISN